ncbi:hypothetical protein GCM10023320_12420 [Pseudonocardia adelaidensis]|uniref:Uncharacterized protein n=2 Tax=Pseudonocardia adelaidensis TaxID=648754 RepID=A0ABP9NEJ3_9PSEU
MNNALMIAGMILFWTLVIFVAIVLVHHLGREDRPATGRTLLISCSPEDSHAVNATSGGAVSTSTPSDNRANSHRCHRPGIRGLRHDGPADGRGTTHSPADGPLRRPTLQLVTGR